MEFITLVLINLIVCYTIVLIVYYKWIKSDEKKKKWMSMCYELHEHSNSQLKLLYKYQDIVDLKNSKIKHMKKINNFQFTKNAELKRKLSKFDRKRDPITHRFIKSK